MKRVLLFGGTSEIATRFIHGLDKNLYDLTVMTGRPWTAPREGIHHYICDLSNYDGSKPAPWHGHYDWVIFIPPLILANSAIYHFTSDRLVFISSHNLRLFGDSPAYEAYVEAEEEVLKIHPHAIILQPTMIIGRENDLGLCRLIQLCQRLPAVPILNKTAKRQPIHFEDVAYAIKLALLKDISPGRYAIAGPDVLSHEQVIKKIQIAIGKRHLTISLPNWSAKIMSKLGGDQLWANQISRAKADRYVDPAISLPGFHSQVSFDQALSRTLKRMKTLKKPI